MNMFSCGWLYAGAILMLMEIMAPGFVIFFFGLAAATVGLIRFACGDAFSLTWQLAAFSALSIVYIVALRRLVKSIFSGRMMDTKTDFDNDYVGRLGKVTEAINPPLPGRVEIGDAQWAATAEEAIAAGADVQIISQNNLTFKVKEISK